MLSRLREVLGLQAVIYEKANSQNPVTALIRGMDDHLPKAHDLVRLGREELEREEGPVALVVCNFLCQSHGSPTQICARGLEGADESECVRR